MSILSKRYRKYVLLSVFIFLTTLPTFGQCDLNWARQFNGTAKQANGKAFVGKDGYIYTMGYFTLSIDVDPGLAATQYVSNGESDVYVSKMDTAGNYISSIHLGGADFDNINGFASDSLGNFYVAGGFHDGVDFNPNGTSSFLYSSGDYDIYLAKYDSNAQLVWVKQMGDSGNETVANWNSTHREISI